jgi:ABC-type lipoprotein export system ATPase subunit
MNLLVELNKKKSITFVFVSHDMHIAHYGKRTLGLKDGKIVGDTNGNVKDFDKVLKKLGKIKEGNKSGS